MISLLSSDDCRTAKILEQYRQHVRHSTLSWIGDKPWPRTALRYTRPTFFRVVTLVRLRPATHDHVPLCISSACNRARESVNGSVSAALQHFYCVRAIFATSDFHHPC